MSIGPQTWIMVVTLIAGAISLLTMLGLDPWPAPSRVQAATVDAGLLVR